MDGAAGAQAWSVPSDLGVLVSVEEVAHNRWLTAEIARVGTSTGSFVVKRLRPDRPKGATPWEAHWTARADEPQHWNFWEREALAYETGLAALWRADGISAPPVATIVRDDGHVDLWLEWIDGVPGERWDLADYMLAARSLGAGQAKVTMEAAGRPWFASSRYLREYSSEKPVPWHLLDSDEAWDQPLVRRAVPVELRSAAARMHVNRDRLYAIVERAPRTLCHLDFWSKNLIRLDNQICLLDWSFCGDGAVGEDIGNLIPDAVFDHFMHADEFDLLEESVFESYLEGMRAAGWVGDPRTVQLGMWASAVKYDWLTPAILESASATRHLAYGGADEVDADYRFSERGRTLLRLTQWADAAIELADALHL